MPKGSKVSECVEKVKKEGTDVNAYAVCQASTGQSYATGKPLKKSEHMVGGDTAESRDVIVPHDKVVGAKPEEGRRKKEDRKRRRAIHLALSETGIGPLKKVKSDDEITQEDLDTGPDDSSRPRPPRPKPKSLYLPGTKSFRKIRLKYREPELVKEMMGERGEKAAKLTRIRQDKPYFPTVQHARIDKPIRGRATPMLARGEGRTIGGERTTSGPVYSPYPIRTQINPKKSLAETFLDQKSQMEELGKQLEEVSKALGEVGEVGEKGEEGENYSPPTATQRNTTAPWAKRGHSRRPADGLKRPTQPHIQPKLNPSKKALKEALLNQTKQLKELGKQLEDIGKNLDHI